MHIRKLAKVQRTLLSIFFFQAEDAIRDFNVTGVQTCALPILLSNLVEEKANKIIEILAAAIPMDALFLGKLFAMLAVSLVGIAVWTAAIGGVMGMPGIESLFGGALSLGDLPAPGVGWPLFLALGVAYFAMAYLLLGSVFLAIGSLANTVREVQTLSMPVTMLQVFLFLFATLAVADRGGWMEWTAIAFPFSSPFAMLARAAQDESAWPHAVALAWQAGWVLLSIRLGAALFRTRVMQSGPQGARRRRPWQRADAAVAQGPRRAQIVQPRLAASDRGSQPCSIDRDPAVPRSPGSARESLCRCSPPVAAGPRPSPSRSPTAMPNGAAG